MTVDRTLQQRWQDKIAAKETPIANNGSEQKVALFLQGGGALGAYQAGVYAALAKAGIDVDWVAGISIGAFNAAIIAGNPPEARLKKLEEFWDRISTPYNNPTLSSIIGVNGFFKPAGTGFPNSIYDVSPMYETLRECVDFDYLNNRSPTRLSVAAADAEDPNLIVYFDSRKGSAQVPPDHARPGDFVLQLTEHAFITPKHILASGALPPAFPPVAIKGHLYVDAGIVPGANCPAVWAAKTGQLDRNTVAITADVWNAPLEHQQAPVIRYSEEERQKDRKFASPPFSIPPSEIGGLVQVVLKRREDQDDKKDYDFSPSAIRANWNAGFADMMGALQHHLDAAALKAIIQRRQIDGRPYLSRANNRESDGLGAPRSV